MGIGTYFIGMGDASASFLRLPVFINVPIGRYLPKQVLTLAKVGRYMYLGYMLRPVDSIDSIHTLHTIFTLHTLHTTTRSSTSKTL